MSKPKLKWVKGGPSYWNITGGNAGFAAVTRDFWGDGWSWIVTRTKDGDFAKEWKRAPTLAAAKRAAEEALKTGSQHAE